MTVIAAQHPLLQLVAQTDHVAQRQRLTQIVHRADRAHLQRLALLGLALQRRGYPDALLALVDAQAQLAVVVLVQAETEALAGQVGLAQVIALHLLETQQVGTAVVGKADAHRIQQRKNDKHQHAGHGREDVSVRVGAAVDENEAGDPGDHQPEQCEHRLPLGIECDDQIQREGIAEAPESPAHGSGQSGKRQFGRGTAR